MYTALDWIGGHWAAACRNCGWSLYVYVKVLKYLQVKSVAVLEQMGMQRKEEERVAETRGWMVGVS